MTAVGSWSEGINPLGPLLVDLPDRQIDLNPRRLGRRDVGPFDEAPVGQVHGGHLLSLFQRLLQTLNSFGCRPFPGRGFTPCSPADFLEGLDEGFRAMCDTANATIDQ